LSDWVSLIASLEGDPRRALSILLQYALDTVQGQFAVCNFFDFECLQILTPYGCRLPADFQKTGPLKGRVCFEELVAAAKPAAVLDNLEHTPYSESDPNVRRFKLKAYIGVAVRVAGRTIGSLSVWDNRVRIFAADACQSLHFAAHLISVAVERQQNEKKLKRRSASDTLLSAISAQVISTQDRSFLDYCLYIIGDSLDIDTVCILWHDPQTHFFHPHSSRWEHGRVAASDRSAFADLLAIPEIRKVIEIKEPFQCNDTDSITDPATRAFFNQNHVTSLLLMPIGNQRQFYGLCAIYTHARPHRWDEESLDTFMAIMSLIAQWKEARTISEELDESQALNHQLFQLSATSVYQIDFKTGRFIKVNDQLCRSTGYSEQELLRMKPEDLLTSASRQVYEQRRADMLAGRTVSSNVEFQIRTKSGALEWGHFHIRHLFTGKQIRGANVVVHMITEQKNAYEELAGYRRRLEALVQERTMELLQANQKLREEVARRTETAKELRLKSERLKELNTAMRVLLDKRNEDRLHSEENIRVNLVQLIEPYLDRLDRSGLSVPQQQLLDVVRINLNEVVSSPMPELSAKYYVFSPGELQVANLIRKGRTTKDMARLLNISPRTVESYRNCIRKKLGLKNKKVNLKTYLSSKE